MKNINEIKDPIMVIKNQLAILRSFITSMIDRDYIYIDVPLYSNMGDWLIALGAWELLKEVSYHCVDKVSWEYLDESKISDDTIILLNGGGNFGDLYRIATEARNEIVERFPRNKIIILPQTITYVDTSLIQSDAKIYNSHADLHICARDNASYDIVKKFFPKAHAYLLPDMAIGLYPILPKYTGGNENKTLVINRNDKEASCLFEDRDAKDWCDILTELGYPSLLRPYKALRKLYKVFRSKKVRWCILWYAIHVMYPWMLKNIPAYFLRFDIVQTTRLHGYLLAIMLHMPVDMKDDSYSKISNYITTWMK